MAKPRPEKKPEPAANATTRVLPMELKVGDHIMDETGEWEVIGHPFTTARSLSTRMRQPGLEFSESAPPPGAHCAWED